MFNFLRSREQMTLQEYQTKLLEENIALMRETLLALGIASKVRPTLSQRTTVVPRTAADVTRVTRQTVLQADREKQEAEIAPWRQPSPTAASGPGFEPTQSPSGTQVEAPPSVVL